MSTFPVKLKLSDLLACEEGFLGERGIQAKGFLDALTEIETAGNWPAGMVSKDKAKIQVCTDLALVLELVKSEEEKKTRQVEFKPSPEDLIPQALDLSVESIPVVTADQFMRTAFDPEHMWVVMGDPNEDEKLRAINFYRKKAMLSESLLYLEQMPDTARIVLETKIPSC